MTFEEWWDKYGRPSRHALYKHHAKIGWEAHEEHGSPDLSDLIPPAAGIEAETLRDKVAIAYLKGAARRRVLGERSAYGLDEFDEVCKDALALADTYMEARKR